MTSFFGELKRRNVVRVAVAYAIVGWILVEVSSTVFPIVQLPDWTVTFLTMLILFGFPIALILSWAYEITPEGMKRSHEIEATESITHVTGRKLDFAIIGALVLALGFVVYNYVLVDGEVAAGVLPNSVAVLPFENMSVDPEEAFYASGIHEEILNQLVKLSALNVIARTSMQQYANTEKSIPEIARELNVETVMEGSVRYADGQIRITVQLNDGVTGAHLWSETYTRDFEDIFAIESDVAMNVANAVGAKFSLAEQESIETIPTDSPEAYRFYLAALDTFVRSDLRGQLLTRAIATDPNFALAYAYRAAWYVVGLNQFPASGIAERERLAREDVDKALAINPDLGAAYVVTALILERNWRGREAEDAYEEAYRLSPNDTYVLGNYAYFGARAGDYETATRLEQRALQLDPSRSSYRLGYISEYARRLDDAAAQYGEAFTLGQTNPALLVHYATVEKIRGNNAEAEEALRRLNLTTAPVMLAQAAYVYSLLGLQDDAETLVAAFEQRAVENRQSAAAWVMAYLARGDEEQSLHWLKIATEKAPHEGYVSIFRIKANHWEDPTLDKPEFVELREQLGFTDL